MKDSTEQVARPRGGVLGTLIRLWPVALAAGTLLLVWSFSLAERAAEDDQTHFVVFWLAAFTALVPLTLWGTARERTRNQGRLAVALLAIWTTLPKILRTWSEPLFSDEFGHLYQTKRVLAEGFFPEKLNPLLRVAPEYPLLHWTTAGLERLGLEIWQAAMLFSSAAHVVTLLAVLWLAHVVTGNHRIGVVAAFVYALQPGWLFFSAQFAYETIGLPLLVLATTTALRARTAKGRRRQFLLFATVVLSAATAAAHHFASLVLLCALVLFAVLGTRRRERRFRNRKGDLVAGAISCALIAAWLVKSGANLWDYYYPTLQAAGNRAADPFAREGSRTVFAGSAAPLWERMAGMAFPFAVLLLYAGSVARARRRLLLRPVNRAFTLFGGTFFLSLPLVFTVSGGEPAHRWWAYCYVGLAVVIGTGLATLPEVDGPRRRSRGALLSALLAVATVGGVTSGITVAYRFPGPAEIGNDARSVSPEARRMAEFLLATEGPGIESGRKVLADRYTAQQIVGYGEQITVRPSPGYPAWDLLLETDPDVLFEVIYMINQDRVGFVVVDERMTSARPRLGYWYNRTEPGAFGEDLVPSAAIEKFRCATWAEELHREGFLTLYRIDTQELIETRGQCVR